MHTPNIEGVTNDNNPFYCRIEWSLKVGTHTCCSDSCPRVRCPFWRKSSVAETKFCPRITDAWNSAGLNSYVMKRKPFSYFFPILLIICYPRALNSLPLRSLFAFFFSSFWITVSNSLLYLDRISASRSTKLTFGRGPISPLSLIPLQMAISFRSSNPFPPVTIVTGQAFFTIHDHSYKFITFTLRPG